MVPVLFLAPPRWHAAHGVMRSLGRRGVRVYSLRHRTASPSNWSRWCAGTVTAGNDGRPIGEDPELVDQLLRAGQQTGTGTILLSGTDEWAVFVARHQAELQSVFRFPVQPEGLVDSLASKQGLHDLAVKFGFPTPALAVPHTRFEAVALSESLTYPVMIKPLESRPDVTAKFVVHDPAALMAAYLQIEESRDSPNVILQEYIPGGDEDVWMFDGYFDADANCRLAFTGQKLRQQPIHMGHTSLGICRENPDLAGQVAGWLTRVGYRGVVDIGFRFDGRNGQYKVLDVNPRVGGNFRQFVGATGIDVVRALYLDLTGQPIPPAGSYEGRVWMKEDSDLVAFAEYRRAGEISLRQWIASVRKVDEGALFAADDPMPFLIGMGLVARDTIQGRLLRPRARLPRTTKSVSPEETLHA